MGIKLMVEVLDDAPDTLTFRERYVLLALAENFNDGTRRGWPGYDGDDERSERFRHRARCTRRQFYETLRGLVGKGALTVVVSGHHGRQAVYAIPHLAAVTGSASSVRENRTLQGDAEGVGEGVREGYPIPLAKGSGAELCAENAHPTDEVVCGFPVSSVRKNRTPTPQVPSSPKSLNAANAARVGWGEGSANASSDAGSRPVAASADATAGDGLRPRGFAAPATNDDQSIDDGEPAPPPVAEVLKNAATGEPSQHPGVGDLVPRQIQRAQQAYEPAPEPEKPPRWLPEQWDEQQAEWESIVGALGGIDDTELNRIETALPRIDFAAFNIGRRKGKDFVAEFSGEPDTDPVRLRRERLYGLMHAVGLRPLATWPQDMLPAALRRAQAQEDAA